jgi:uncharacterized protein DUF5916/cellulose/xylan binding protein with CBM9 domain
LRTPLLVALVLFCRAPLHAQEATTPTAAALRIMASPVIDGRLNEPVWETAHPITEFRQQEPLEGEPSTESTDVRIVYDDTQLYIGIRITDSEPTQIRAAELRRDNTLEADDTFTVLLDTYHDHRNAFLFRINPRGTRFDAMIRNESAFLTANWDEQWTAAAVITESGWTAEIAIPFKILRFSGDEEQVWGLNFERVIKRKNEFVYWAAWDRDYMFTHVSQAGHLTGLSDIRQAERLRIRPYVLAGSEQFDAIAQPDSRFVREIGIEDLKYSVTPNLTADATLNPDFAQAEADTQQVNLTRFSLYFQEKRQFFIEGSDSLRMSVGFLHFGPPPLEIFYSRRIGLSDDGVPTPLAGGGKITGKVGGFDVGALTVQSDSQDGLASENFAVGRVRKEILSRSYVGAIVTNRQGDGRFNRVVGADARFVFFRYLNIAALAAKSSESATPESSLPGADKQWVRQAGVEWRADKLEGGVNYIGIDPGFNPAAGFVRRHDRMFGQRVSYKPRPRGNFIRQLEFTPTNVAYYNDTGTLLSRNSHVPIAAAFQSGDRLELDIANVAEVLLRPFNVGPVRLPVGSYEWNESTMTFRSYNGRAVSGVAGFTVGDFYNGTKRTWNLSTDLRPGEHLSLQPTYSFNDVDLAQGSFNTHLVGIRSNVSFNTNVLTSAYVQYNSAGELAAVQVRFNYIFRTIDNVIVAYNEVRYTDGLFSGMANRSLVMKVTYSVHR